MTDLALRGTEVHGAVDQACTPNPDPASTAATGPAAASSRACTAGHRLDPSVQTGAAQPFYKAVPAWVGFSFHARALPPAARGYATPGFLDLMKSQMEVFGGRRPAPAPAKAGTTNELAFLDDKNLSIEDKLMRFMALMLEKADRELVDKMKEYEAKKKAQDAKEANGSSGAKGSSGANGSGGGGGGLLGDLGGALSGIFGGGGGGGGGDLFGGIGDALGGIGSMLTGGAGSLIKDLGGPVLGAVCTAVAPFLAPLAMKLGGELGSLASSAPGASGASAQSGGSASGTAASSSRDAKAASGSDENFDERLEMMKLQRLVEKINAMFQALSNVMKSMHDAQMNAVANIR